MKRFDRVKTILDVLVGGRSVRAHGPFWRGKTLQEFVVLAPFGQRLLVPGDGNGSNLVKALRGQVPFGSDSGTPGSMFRRMPAGMPRAEESQVRYISEWIDDGCPDEEEPAGLSELRAAEGVLSNEGVDHNAYWREFDDWAMFNASEDTLAAIGEFFTAAEQWFGYAKGLNDGSAWRQLIARQSTLDAINHLSMRQRASVTAFYGDPPDVDRLFDSYKRFGEGSLPRDPLRPLDQYHRMNGEVMWFVWAAFADSCLASGVDADFWTISSRAVLIGALHDGLFRGRYRVQGFAATTEGSAQILAFMRNLPEAALSEELRMRYAQSGK